MPTPSQGPSGIPFDAICFFRDGDKWCCVRQDFEDLQSSPAGFGATLDDAMTDFLQREEATDLSNTREAIETEARPGRPSDLGGDSSHR